MTNVHENIVDWMQYINSFFFYQYLWVVVLGSSPSTYFGQLIITVAEDGQNTHSFAYYGAATESSKELDLPVDKRLALQIPDDEKTIMAPRSSLEKVEALHTCKLITLECKE